MNKLTPFYYNIIDNFPVEEINSLQEKAYGVLEPYKEMLDNYEVWKKSIKDYNKFQQFKHRKLDYSRFAWHKEVEKLEKLYDKVDQKHLQTLITTVFDDAFEYLGNIYYPVDFPQIFNIEMLPGIFENYKEFSEKIDLDFNIHNHIFKIDSEDKISVREIKNSVAEFFDKYPQGLLFLSEKIIKGDPN